MQVTLPAGKQGKKVKLWPKLLLLVGLLLAAFTSDFSPRIDIAPRWQNSHPIMSEPPPPAMADGAEVKQEHFRFFNLPPELRDNILEILVNDPAVYPTHDHHRTYGSYLAVWIDHRTEGGWFDAPLEYRFPKFLAVSRQFRAEAGAVYFKNVRFYFDEYEVAARWLAVLERPLRSCIKFFLHCTGVIRSNIDDANVVNAENEEYGERFLARSEADWRTLKSFFAGKGLDVSKCLHACEDRECRYPDEPHQWVTKHTIGAGAGGS